MLYADVDVPAVNLQWVAIRVSVAPSLCRADARYYTSFELLKVHSEQQTCVEVERSSTGNQKHLSHESDCRKGCLHPVGSQSTQVSTVQDLTVHCLTSALPVDYVDAF